MENEAIITGLFMRKTHKYLTLNKGGSQVKIHERRPGL